VPVILAPRSRPGVPASAASTVILTAMNETDLEAMAAALEASGKYRVLRQISLPRASRLADANLRKAVFLDVETTGLRADRDEVIQLAMLPFQFDDKGRVVGVLDGFNAFSEPSRPIPPLITRITGITDDDVRGKSIDPGEVAAVLDGAELVIAHNAGFDRPFVERLLPDLFEGMPWACSASEVGWRRAGFEGAKLEYLTMMAGSFYDKHRADADCEAGVYLLAQQLNGTDETALAELLRRSAQIQHRIHAVGAPFDSKDHLKRRRYRWNPGNGSQPKAWWTEVGEDALEAELAWLSLNIPRCKPMVISIGATDRFSVRVGVSSNADPE